MFEYSLTHWITFVSAAALLNLSPGPDMAYVLAQTASKGRRGGFAAMFGVWAGSYLHVIMAALGLSAILAASALAFTTIKWLGVAYLIWIGLVAIFSARENLSTSKKKIDWQYWSIFKQGVLISALNPKVAIFFLAFLPQFVVEGAGSVSLQLLLHGSLIIVVAVFIEPPMVLLGSRLTDYYRRSARLGLWMQKGLGVFLVGLGLRLAMTER
ncbi:MAG: LysE family translocator [Gammaproteobacteria bacterium]|nr:LysE family translocator [Gammaproteobacteria bacterium]